MAQEYDGSIRIGVDVDFSNMTKSTKEIEQRLEGVKGALQRAEKTLSQTFDGKLVNNTAVALENTRQKVQSLANDYNDLLFSDQPPKSVMRMEDELTKLESQIRKADAAFEELAAEQTKLANKRVDYGGLTGDEEARFKEIDNLIIENGYTVDKLNEKISYLRGNLQNLRANPQATDEAKKLALRLDEATTKLEGLNNKAAFTGTKISASADRAGRSIKNAMNPATVKEFNSELKKSGSFVNSLGSHFQQLGKRIVNTVKNVLLFSAITSGLGKMRDEMGRLLQTNEYFVYSLQEIKNNLKAAFYPIYTAVLPALNALMAGIVKVTGFIASFINTLFGTTPQKSLQAANSLFKYADALEELNKKTNSGSNATNKNTAAQNKNNNAVKDQADSLKDAQKELENTEKTVEKVEKGLAGFDTLNILNNQTTSSNPDIKDDFDDYDKYIDDYIDDLQEQADAQDDVLDNYLDALKNAQLNASDALSAGALDFTLFDGLKEKLAEIEKAFQKVKNLFVEGFFDAFENVDFGSGSTGLEGIRNVLTEIAQHAISAGQSIREIFTDPTLVESAEHFAESVITALGQITGSAAVIGLSVAQNLIGGMDQFLNQRKSEIVSSFTAINNAVADTASQLGQFSMALANIFSEIGSENGQQLTANILSIFSDAALGVAELGAKIGRDFITMLTEPIIENQDSLKTAFSGIIGTLSQVSGTIAETSKTAWNSVQTLYDEHVSPFFAKVTEVASAGIGAFAEEWNAKGQPVLDEMAQKFDETSSEKINPAIQHLGSAFGDLFDVFGRIVEDLSPLFETFMGSVADALATVAESVGKIANKILGVIGNMVDGFAGEIESLAQLLNIAVDSVEAWGKAFSGIGDAIGSVVETIESFINTIKSFYEIVSALVKGFAQIEFSKITDAFTGASNSVSSAAPASAPINAAMNGGTMEIPALARGAVIPPNAEFLALLGDQKRGTNIEAPLETIVEAFRQAQGDQNNSAVNVMFTGDLAGLGRVLQPVISRENKRIGSSFAAGGVY